MQYLLFAPIPAHEPDAPAGWAGQPLCGLLIDIHNAFNCINRAVVVERLIAEPRFARVVRFVTWSLQAPSLLLARGSNGSVAFSMSSSQGVRQGDPMSSLLFALAIQPCIEPAPASSRSLSWTTSTC